MPHSHDQLTELLRYNDAPIRLASKPSKDTLFKTREKTEFRCLLSGCVFVRTLSDVLSIIRSSDGRPLCTVCSNRFMHEAKCKFILEQLLKKTFIKARPKWLHKLEEAMPLELDGYCESAKLAFEYQGEQHFEPFGYITQDDVNEIKSRDALKIELCKSQKIVLLVIEPERRAGNLEEQIRTKLSKHRIDIKSHIINWPGFKIGTKSTAENRAEIHAARQGYKLWKPAPSTPNDGDFQFKCHIEDHKWFKAKKIFVERERPSCSECGHAKRVETMAEQKLQPIKVIRDMASLCLPPMHLLHWAGQDRKNKRLYKCTEKYCGYVSSYSDNEIKKGKGHNICMKCKPSAKPRVQKFEVLKKAFDFGGSCTNLPSTNITKKTFLTFKCFNEEHKEFQLSVKQLIDNNMWCSEPTCDERTKKKAKIQKSEIIQKIRDHYEGLDFKKSPKTGQDSPLDLICKKCNSPVKNRNGSDFTYKLLTKNKGLMCTICEVKLGTGWNSQL